MDYQDILNIQYQTALVEQKAADMRYAAALESNTPFTLLRPRLFPDGNMWCALLGENLQDGICAFGETPERAAAAFSLAWFKERCGSERP